MDDKYQKPTQSAGDAGHSIVKAVLSLIPVAGGPATELFAFLIAPPIEKRRDEWIQELVDGLRVLEAKVEGMTIESLVENEVFTTTLIHATRIAVANHDHEKRLALRNAVLNSALPEAPDDTKQKIFMGWLDELTTWHLKILALFERKDIPVLDLDNNDWRINIALGRLSRLIEDAYPEMEHQHDTYIPIIADLHSKGLIVNKFPTPGLASKIERSPRLSPLGEAFLEFAKSPIDTD